MGFVRSFFFLLTYLGILRDESLLRTWWGPQAQALSQVCALLCLWTSPLHALVQKTVIYPGPLLLHGFQPKETACPVSLARRPQERPCLVHLRTRAHLWTTVSTDQVWVTSMTHISHPCPVARSSEGAVRLAQLLRTRLAPGRRNSRSTNREGAVQMDRSSSCFLYMFSKKGKRRAGLSSHG